MKNSVQKYIKLAEYARNKSVTYTTAWNHFKRGIIKGAFKDESGHVLIPAPNNADYSQAVLYSRVSPNELRENLSRQENRLREYAARNGYTLIKSVSEVGSGMNDDRPKLTALLEQEDWTTLIVENKDRLTRFGFNYIKNLLAKHGKQIVVVNESEVDSDNLMEDLISIVYSFSAKMYGLRRKKNKEEIIKFLESE